MNDLYSAMVKTLGIKPEDFIRSFAERRMVPLPTNIEKDSGDGIETVLMSLDFKEVAPITLLIDSNGGDVTSSNNIIGVMKMIRSPVNALVIGRCASMAVDILLNCQERRALSHATFFMHFTRCGFNVVKDDGEISDSEMMVLRKKLTANKKQREEFYVTLLNKSPEEIHELFRYGEKYNIDYTAQEALELGLIDKIVTDFKFFPEKKK